MEKLNYDVALYYFRNYVYSKIWESANDSNKIKGINKKITHTLDVVYYGKKIASSLGFNDSCLELSKICLLDHDVGRFMQMANLGTYDDYVLKNEFQGEIEHHGDLGEIILRSELLKKQIQSTRVFDNCIATVVKDHVTKEVDSKDLLILSKKILANESAYDIFNKCDDEVKKQVISTLTQLVQDVDRLDIYYQIIFDKFNCKSSSEEISQTVFDKFYNGEYLNMNELKKQGLWNCNVGELVRLSFVNQIKLLEVAKMIKHEKIIEKMRIKNNNLMVKDAYDITIQKLDESIKNSEDGIVVGKVKTLTHK